MNLLSYALVSLADMKTYLGIDNSAQDERLKMFINMATESIESYCGRRFKKTSYTDQKYDGTGDRRLVLKNYPITVAPAIAENSETDGSGSWTIIDTDDYNTDLVNGIIRKNSDFKCGFQNYQIDYEAGYDDIPYDLQFACMSYVSELYKEFKQQGISSERLGDHTVSYRDPLSSSSMEKHKETLEKYKNINI